MILIIAEAQNNRKPSYVSYVNEILVKLQDQHRMHQAEIVYIARSRNIHNIYYNDIKSEYVNIHLDVSIWKVHTIIVQYIHSKG